MSFGEGKVEVGEGVSMYYRDYPPLQNGLHDVNVICLPGLTRNSADFEDFAPTLRDALGCRVMCPDLRGRAKSDRDPNPMNYTPEQYAKDVGRLMEVLELHNVVIMGTSLGAFLGIICGTTHRARIIGMVLNDAGPEVPQEAVERIMKFAGLPARRSVWSEVVDVVRATNGAQLPYMNDEGWDTFARRTWIERQDAETGEKYFEPNYDFNIRQALVNGHAVPLGLWEKFASLTMPLLLVQGAKSDILTGDILERMKEMQKGIIVQVLSLENVGHAPQLCEPGVEEAIEKFIRRLVVGGEGSGDGVKSGEE